jgi:S-adenosylmethionine hydrolase
MLPIYLLTDFGTSDEWVAVLKGAIRTISPTAEVSDISHDIPPFDLCKGAVVLAAAAPFLPPGVHLAVVDPGVGTERRALLLECGRGDLLLGPDNGLLLPAAGRLGGISAAWSVEAEALLPHSPHPTFHGRDVFAPVAARP